MNACAALSGACFILAVCVCQASHQTCHLTVGLFPSDGLGDVEQQLSESDDEASPLPVAPGANLRPGIVHRLDKGTTGSSCSSMSVLLILLSLCVVCVVVSKRQVASHRCLKRVRCCSFHFRAAVMAGTAVAANCSACRLCLAAQQAAHCSGLVDHHKAFTEMCSATCNKPWLHACP